MRVISFTRLIRLRYYNHISLLQIEPTSEKLTPSHPPLSSLLCLHSSHLSTAYLQTSLFLQLQPLQLQLLNHILNKDHQSQPLLLHPPVEFQLQLNLNLRWEAEVHLLEDLQEVVVLLQWE